MTSIMTKYGIRVITPESENPETIRQFKDLVLIKANWDTLGVEIYMD
jgi:hypothetical protein